MNKMVVRRALIGIMGVTVVILGMAAVSDSHSARYSFALSAGSTPGTFLICIGDTYTGKYAIERCVEQLPAANSMMTHIGIYANPLTEKPAE